MADEAERQDIAADKGSWYVHTVSLIAATVYVLMMNLRVQSAPGACTSIELV